MIDYCNFTRNQIYNLDALTMLKTMPDESVNCIITSPPYFGLRDYGVDGQIGLEPTLKEFIDTLVTLFREARRVLRSDGTCWINMGDSYANDGKWGGSTGGKHVEALHGDTGIGRSKKDTGLKPKDLCGQPWRLVFALQDDGWYLRSDIIWHKPNPMPESVSDRPTKSHEYVFLLTKSEHYWYDAEAIREPAIYAGDKRGDRPDARRNVPGANHMNSTTGENRNKRSVWTIPTEPTPFAHFATFPQALIEPMILAGCPKEVCSVCGAPYVRVVEATGGTIGNSWVDHDLDSVQGVTRHGSSTSMKDGTYQRVDKGFAPTCSCHASTRPGVVYDPFMGSGTTAIVAQRLGRDFCGTELNYKYLAIACDRLRQPFEPRKVETPQAIVLKQPVEDKSGQFTFLGTEAAS